MLSLSKPHLSDSLSDLIQYLLITLLFGAVGGLIGGSSGFSLLTAPPLTPPGWVFPIVWTLLYILMAVAAWMIRKSGGENQRPALRLYWVQLLVNALWPLLFFRLSLHFLALLWILLLIGLIVLLFRRFYAVHPPAAFLLIPYLAWCLFASYLNLGFYLLNR